MNNRDRFLAVMNDQSYDRLPIIHFGYWNELLDKWALEGHITQEDAKNWQDGNETCRDIGKKLGFDFGFQEFISTKNGLDPCFKDKVISELPDGSKHIRNGMGVTELEIPGTLSIRAEIEHLLVDRASYDKFYKWRLQPSTARLPVDLNAQIEYWNHVTDRPNKLHLGSAIGEIRSYLGVVGMSYMMLDDPDLLVEIIDTVNEVSYCNAKAILEAGLRPDMAHYWEDICFNHGSLVPPDYFKVNITKHYRKMSELLRSYHCNLLSVDCDGMIEELLPFWLEAGVNTMFPIEIGTWHPDFAVWRKKYGKDLRGIGAMNKHVLSMDKQNIDKEIERIKYLVELGGFIPCPDHRLPPETKWELTQYYTEQMRRNFYAN